MGKQKSASLATPLVVARIPPVRADSDEERRLNRIKKEVKKWFVGIFSSVFSGDINLIREAATAGDCWEIAVEAGRADLDQGQLFLQFEKDLAKHGQNWEKMELWKACRPTDAARTWKPHWISSAPRPPCPDPLQVLPILSF